MKVSGGIESMYPTYTINEHEADLASWEAKVPASTVRRWRRVIAEYEKVQSEIDKVAEGVTRTNLPRTPANRAERVDAQIAHIREHIDDHAWRHESGTGAQYRPAATTTRRRC